MLRIRQTTLTTSAAYADSTIQVAIPKSGSPIYQYIKSFLLFLITETARQIADNIELFFYISNKKSRHKATYFIGAGYSIAFGASFAFSFADRHTAVCRRSLVILAS